MLLHKLYFYIIILLNVWTHFDFSVDLPGECKSLLRLPVTAMSVSQAFPATLSIINCSGMIVSNALFCFLMYNKPVLLKKISRHSIAEFS